MRIRGPSKLPAANSRSGSTEGHGANGNLCATGVLLAVCRFFSKLAVKKRGHGKAMAVSLREFRRPSVGPQSFNDICQKHIVVSENEMHIKNLRMFRRVRAARRLFPFETHRNNYQHSLYASKGARCSPAVPL